MYPIKQRFLRRATKVETKLANENIKCETDYKAPKIKEAWGCRIQLLNVARSFWGQAAARQGIGPRQVNLWQSVNHPRYYSQRLLMPQLKVLPAARLGPLPPFSLGFRTMQSLQSDLPLCSATLSCSTILFHFFCFPALRLFVRKLLLICGNVNAELCTKLVKFLARPSRLGAAD